MSLLARIQLDLETFTRDHGASYVAQALSVNEHGATSYTVEMHRNGSVHEGVGASLEEARTAVVNAYKFGFERRKSAPAPLRVQGDV